MGMQISCGVYYERPEENLVWSNPAGVGASFSGTGGAEGVRDNRRASDGRSCAYAALDSAEVFGGAGTGVPEGENGDPHSAGVCRAQRELRGAAVLGARLLGVDGGTGRSRGASLHPGTGKRRSAAGSTDADAALSGSHYLKPPALPEVA